MKNLYVSLTVIVSILLSACASIPSTDWCYIYDFTASDYSASLGNAVWESGTGFRSLSSGSVKSVVIATGITATPSYFRVAYNVQYTGEQNVRILGATLFGNSYSQDTNMVTGPTSIEVDFEASGNTGSSLELGIQNSSGLVYLTRLTVYGNGSNPFPSNDCAAPTDAPTITPGGPTETATPGGPTATPTPEPYVYATLPAATPGDDGQMTRFDYTASAGDVQLSNQMSWILYSLWGMFIFWFFDKGRKK